MTFDDRVRALAPLGCSPRQTRFLVTVALHGGYCVRRQYLAFAGVQYGKNVRDFLDGLVERHLAARFLCRADRGHVYHLHGRSIYRALRQDDNRNRKESSAALIARKLMVLDYVLSRPDVEWLATEEDKVELFAGRFGLPTADLPQRLYRASQPGRPDTVRYFVHKLPVAVVGKSPVVHVVYLANDRTGVGFEHFLGDHARLFSRLSAWCVVAICPHELDGLAACQSAFDRFTDHRCGAAASRDDLRHHFALRQLIERGELTRVTVSDIGAFRQQREALHTRAIEQLYANWLAHGDEALTTLDDAPSKADRLTAGRLVTEPLPFSYTQFGSLPGVA